MDKKSYKIIAKTAKTKHIFVMEAKDWVNAIFKAPRYITDDTEITSISCELVVSEPNNHKPFKQSVKDVVNNIVRLKPNDIVIVPDKIGDIDSCKGCIFSNNTYGCDMLTSDLPKLVSTITGIDGTIECGTGHYTLQLKDKTIDLTNKQIIIDYGETNS